MNLKTNRLSKRQEEQLMLAVDRLLCNTEKPESVGTRVLFSSRKEVMALREVYTECLKNKYGKDYRPLFESAHPVYKLPEEE